MGMTRTLVMCPCCPFNTHPRKETMSDTVIKTLESGAKTFTGGGFEMRVFKPSGSDAPTWPGSCDGDAQLSLIYQDPWGDGDGEWDQRDNWHPEQMREAAAVLLLHLRRTVRHPASMGHPLR